MQNFTHDLLLMNYCCFQICFWNEVTGQRKEENTVCDKAYNIAFFFCKQLILCILRVWVRWLCSIKFLNQIPYPYSLYMKFSRWKKIKERLTLQP
jgi:hypothetical protein